MLKFLILLLDDKKCHKQNAPVSSLCIDDGTNIIMYGVRCLQADN